MKLSDGEKLILVMLSELYEKVGVKGGIDPTFVREAIDSGNEWGLKWEYPGVFEADTKDSGLVTEVCDILQMWWLMESAYGKLSPDERSRVDKEIDPFEVKFEGFDGNNESEHRSVALFLINHLDRFGHFKGRDLNSHSISLEPVRRMLPTFRSLLGELGTRTMNGDDIVTLMKARRHPSARS
jgi:uncharacterized protein YfbU (UPF0304 family)